MVDGIRELRQANIWGGVMCYPREVFYKMKPIPIVPGTTYHYYSDYFRTLDVRKLGYRTVYVKTDTPPLHVLVDTPERTEEKRQQTQKCMEYRHLWDPSYRRA
jgi:hypothetical protein